MPVDIIRGADKKFIIKLRQKANVCDPFDLTDVTKIQVKFKKCGTQQLIIDDTEVAAVKATASLTLPDTTVVTFTATDGGALWNPIQLVFDGVQDIQTVVDAHNTAFPTLTIVHDAPLGTEVPDEETIQFANGYDAYFNVQPIGALELGNIQIYLTEAQTQLLDKGDYQSLEIILDKGPHPTGERIIVLIEEALNVS